MFGKDPQLRNHMAFNDLSQEEKQIDLWGRMNTLKLNYANFLPSLRIMEQPIKDFFAYPQG